LFTGDAGSGESEIRKWIIENDWLECIVALPDRLFFNTGISTYVWLLSNRKEGKRKGKIQLIDGTGLFEKMRKNMGEKSKLVTTVQQDQILDLYLHFKENEISKIYPNHFFGYTKITVEQPLVENGAVVVDKKSGKPKPNSELRDFERVPLSENIEEYFEREVKPHLPNTWMDRSKDKVGYEINFTKYFYKYQPLRPVEEILNDLQQLEAETDGLFNELTLL
jgi:type I restriction enzyme M protein